MEKVKMPIIKKQIKSKENKICSSFSILGIKLVKKIQYLNKTNWEIAGIPFLSNKTSGNSVTYRILGIQLLKMRLLGNKFKLYLLGIPLYVSKASEYQKEKINCCTFDKDYFQKKLWDVYTPLKVQLSDNRKACVNIIIPGLYPKMSAGPLSILWVAQKLSDWGYNIRFLPMSSQNQNQAAKMIACQEKGLEKLSSKAEIDFSLADGKTIYVSPQDMTVATLFNSAFMAKQLQALCKDKKFIYMIQDYERDFFEASSNGFIAYNTYELDYYGLFSTELLEKFFLRNNIGRINERHIKHISYPCPGNSYLPAKEEFLKNRKAKKQFVFYSRPHADRNAYDLSAYTIIKAVEDGIFNCNEWEFWGVGATATSRIKLKDGVFLNQMPNMPLEEYKKMLPQFDLMLSLMATPHPSMPPIDLAMSGCVVVTNSSELKSQEEFGKICKNIIACHPNLDSLLDGLRQGIKRSGNLEQRYRNAVVEYPSHWEDVFEDRHQKWFKDILG